MKPEAGKRQERLGFRTSSATLEDEFTALQSLLEQKKITWSELREYANSEISDLRILRQDARFKQGVTTGTASLILITQYKTLLFIAEMGSELSEIHKRLAAIEKRLTK